MLSDKESFEEAQNRVLGKTPSHRRRLLRGLKQLRWGRIFRSAFFISIFLLFGLRSILQNRDSSIYVFIVVWLAIFAVATFILIAVQLYPFESTDEET